MPGGLLVGVGPDGGGNTGGFGPGGKTGPGPDGGGSIKVRVLLDGPGPLLPLSPNGPFLLSSRVGVVVELPVNVGILSFVARALGCGLAEVPASGIVFPAVHILLGVLLLGT